MLRALKRGTEGLSGFTTLKIYQFIPLSCALNLNDLEKKSEASLSNKYLGMNHYKIV